ncbi:MAG: hypothetical protein AAF558_15460, partial [Verrucomicrobiota bacterium]
IEPLWPVSWLGTGDPSDLLIYAILYANLIATLLVLIAPEFRSLRIFLFVAFLEYIAFRNSFGKINHWGHLMLLISFVLIFLPKGWSSLVGSRTVQIQTLSTIAACQAMILVTYTMSGLGKIIVGGIQMAQGKANSFSPDALARHISERLLETSETSYLGDWIINYPWMGWPMMFFAIYLQTVSIFILFRPALHRIWGVAHLLFHVGVFLTMTISFNESSFLVALFLIASPFTPTPLSFGSILRELPLFGNPLSRLRA